jgi:esterase/lipase
MQRTEDRLLPLRFAEPVLDRFASVDRTIRRYAAFHHEICNEPERARVLADLENRLQRQF